MITERGIGIFNLETTNYPLISEHADTLQPLWKSARRLSENETTAEQEIAAVFDQIQSALTAQQRQAISVTELSILDMGVIAEDLGLDFGMGQLADHFIPLHHNSIVQPDMWDGLENVWNCTFLMHPKNFIRYFPSTWAIKLHM